MCILLIPIAAMKAFRANRWRIKAAVDERLMKGLSETFFQNHIFDSLSQSQVARLSSSRNPGPIPDRCALGPCRYHSPLTAHKPPRNLQKQGRKHCQNSLQLVPAWRPIFLRWGRQFSEFSFQTARSC